MAVVVIGIAYFSLILGELVPKRIALGDAEGIASRLARFMRGLAILGTPIEWLLSATADLILKFIPVRSEPTAVTDEEIGFMLREGVAAGSSRSGRLRSVLARACSRRQRRIDSWFPLISTSGTFQPRKDGGRV